MSEVKEKDFGEIRLASVITEYDKSVILALYQPIIGHVSVDLFLTMVNKWQLEQGEPFSHNNFLNATDMNLTAFNLARKRLEGVGLIRTYQEKSGDFFYYTYELYAPKSAFDFFDDQLFRGMLVKTVGAKVATHLALLFRADDRVKDDLTEVSASFMDIYRPDLNDPAFNEHIDNFASAARHGRPVVEFDQDKFFAELLKQAMIKSDAIDASETKECIQLAVLYGVDEITMAKCVSASYSANNKLGERLDRDLLRHYLSEENKYTFTQPKNNRKKIIHSEAEVSKMINLMETMPPIDFLAMLQHGRPLVPSDRHLLEDLALKFGLVSGVINALIFTVLNLKNNQLPYAYTTKIAAALVRSNIDNALDATNFLRDNLRSLFKPKTNRKDMAKSNLTKESEHKSQAPLEEMSAEEMAELTKILEKM